MLKEKFAETALTGTVNDSFAHFLDKVKAMQCHSDKVKAMQCHNNKAKETHWVVTILTLNSLEIFLETFSKLGKRMFELTITSWHA